MKPLAPGNGMLALRKEMDRLFDRIWDRDWFETGQMVEGYAPPLDMVETDTDIEVVVDVPGMEAKDIHVTVRDNLEKERKDEKSYRMERTFGAFTRHIALPVPVDASKVNASVHNGVLKVTLPKTAAAKGMEVPVLAK
jgi:HSP20 family protein